MKSEALQTLKIDVVGNWQVQELIGVHQKQQTNLMKMMKIGMASIVLSVVEVNRFPGLEARDESDRGVKERVLLAAWDLACSRHNVSDAERKTVFGELLQSMTASSACLEPVL